MVTVCGLRTVDSGHKERDDDSSSYGESQNGARDGNDEGTWKTPS